MRILFHKLTSERHALEIVHEDGRRERMECETRSYLTHDLLHYAVEAEGALTTGFWGTLARGKTLTELNDRTRTTPGYATAEGMLIEQIVGVLSGVTKGRTAAELLAALERITSSSGQAMPAWLTIAFVEGVEERMRRLLGRWKATSFGEAMALDWPAL